jgi:hypothetical protein
LPYFTAAVGYQNLHLQGGIHGPENYLRQFHAGQYAVAFYQQARLVLSSGRNSSQRRVVAIANVFAERLLDKLRYSFFG